MKNLTVIENDLVPVYETSTGEKVVYGSELHAVLEVRSRFNDWIRNRLNDCDAIEKEDYEAFTKNLVSGGKAKEYIIKLDTAKEMAMLERNEKGKQVRRYFIAVEKKYKEQRTNKDCNLTNSDYMEMLRIICTCDAERFQYVASILNIMGFSSHSAKSKSNDRNGNAARETHIIKASAGSNDVADFLQGTDVLNKPTNDVYNEYLAYCATYNIVPVSKIVFSKMVNKILGTRVIQKKINNVNKKVFSM